LAPDEHQVAQLKKLRTKGFTCLPMPLGGYLITDLAGKPMLATPYPHTPVHYLAPGNFVEINQPIHDYTYEV
jgi:hypothetical protein